MDVMVERDRGDRWRVRIVGRGATTGHVVTVPAAVPAMLGCASADPAWLVRVSMEFLLEREPPSSILRSFRLDEIARYFPDYPEEIRRRWAAYADSASEASGGTDGSGC